MAHGKPARDLVGQRFGPLVVTGRDFYIQAATVHWICKCDCGKTCTKSGHQLVHQPIKSCSKDCAVSGRPIRSIREITIAAFLRRYKKGAKSRNYCWELTDQQAEILASSSCFYCGKDPSKYKFRFRVEDTIDLNGIDRIDNSKGYTADNCVPCCKMCNRLKAAYSYPELYNHIQNMASYMPKEPVAPMELLS